MQLFHACHHTFPCVPTHIWIRQTNFYSTPGNNVYPAHTFFHALKQKIHCALQFLEGSQKNTCPTHKYLWTHTFFACTPEKISMHHFPCTLHGLKGYPVSMCYTNEHPDFHAPCTNGYFTYKIYRCISKTYIYTWGPKWGINGFQMGICALKTS